MVYTLQCIHNRGDHLKVVCKFMKFGRWTEGTNLRNCILFYLVHEICTLRSDYWNDFFFYYHYYVLPKWCVTNTVQFLWPISPHVQKVHINVWALQTEKEPWPWISVHLNYFHYRVEYNSKYLFIFMDTNILHWQTQYGSIRSGFSIKCLCDNFNHIIHCGRIPEECYGMHRKLSSLEGGWGNGISGE